MGGLAFQTGPDYIRQTGPVSSGVIWNSWTPHSFIIGKPSLPS